MSVHGRRLFGFALTTSELGSWSPLWTLAGAGSRTARWCIHSQFSAEMTKEDPDIQMLLDHAKDLYSSLFWGKTTLADDMLCDFDQTREGYTKRFLVVSKYGDPSLAVVLSYELSSHPAAFFEAKNILCTADKPQIAQAI
ncbi:hypothetical protein DPMN_006610 [Dreissena polymorpha]|uniref:Uncharacterized protein n=1 Tax=Dreissena polymorpha TaxID=45954 RepID=A0A9D4MUC0_DREPO|nr:hypothetical protein DPMN_006610 [Dreissena polymorpha]